MNKSVLALAGVSFAAGIVLFVVLSPLFEPKAQGPELAMIAKPTIQEMPSPPPPEQFPDARRAIIRILKDPDSAKFGTLFERPAKRIVCGEVNSKNSYGGYTGMTPFVYFNETDRAELITNPAARPMTKEGIHAYYFDCRG
jgi:hypothetical protein